MSKFKFTLNTNGVKQLLQSIEMQQVIQSSANQIQSRVGEGYEVTTIIGKNRATSRVTADTLEARKDNADNNTLLKALL